MTARGLLLEGMVNENAAPGAVKQTTRLLHASALAGCEVVGDQGDCLGTVVDFVLDCTAGTVAYVVVASGGFMGVGETRYEVPWTHMVPLAGAARFRCRDGRLLPRYQLAPLPA